MRAIFGPGIESAVKDLATTSPDLARCLVAALTVLGYGSVIGEDSLLERVTAAAEERKLAKNSLLPRCLLSVQFGIDSAMTP